jgi:predicted nucleic acid-binding protein
MSGIDAVLDTNAVIYLQKGILVEPLPVGRYGISIITEIELFSAPLLSEEDQQWLSKFTADVYIINIDDTIIAKTIELRKSYHLKIPDAIIAASAIIHNSSLITNDKVFYNIGGLTCRELKLRSLMELR